MALVPSMHDPVLDLPIGLDEAAALPRPAEAAGAHDAVLRLFDAHRDGVHRYVRALGIADGDGEDLVQDVFLALFHHVARGRPRTNLRGWIFRVAHNLALRHLTREARRRRSAPTSRRDGPSRRGRPRRTATRAASARRGWPRR